MQKSLAFYCGYRCTMCKTMQNLARIHYAPLLSVLVFVSHHDFFSSVQVSWAALRVWELYRQRWHFVAFCKCKTWITMKSKAFVINKNDCNNKRTLVCCCNSLHFSEEAFHKILETGSLFQPQEHNWVLGTRCCSSYQRCWRRLRSGLCAGQ